MRVALVVRTTLLVLGFAVASFADLMETTTYSGLGTGLCLPEFCSAAEGFLPQFDSSLGTLESMTITLGQEVIFDVDNCPDNEPPPLLNYTFQATAWVTALGQMSTPVTQSGSGQTAGGCAGLGPKVGVDFPTSLTISDLADLTPFIGNGSGLTVPIFITPFAEGSIDLTGGEGGVVGTSLETIIGSSGSIEVFGGKVTYDYIAATPEPKMVILLLVACGLVAVWHRYRRNPRSI